MAGDLVLLDDPGAAELEQVRPRTRLIEKPYSLVLLVETLEQMLTESDSQNLHSQS